VDGTLRGDLDLVIPLSDDPVSVELALDITSGELYMPEQALRFKGIEGPLQISTRTGLTSKGLNVEWLDQPLIVGLQTDTSTADWRLHFPAQGVVNLAALGQWLEDPWLMNQPYTVWFTGDLSTHAGDLDLSIKSDLVGLPIDFPPPLGKPIGAPRPFNLALTLTEQRQAIKGYLGDQLTFNLNTTDDLIEGVVNLAQPTAGIAHLPQILPVIEPGLFTVNIDLPEIDASVWWAQWRELQALYLPSITEAETLTDRASVLRDQIPINVVSVRAGRLHWEDVNLQNLKLHGERTGNGWHLGMESVELAGDLSLPVADEDFGELTLDYARFDVGSALPRAEVIPVESTEPSRRTRPPYEYLATEDALAGIA
ncbi:MAG: DUF3971 domain-containing protein, partial [Natronospirillum sp.]